MNCTEIKRIIGRRKANDDGFTYHCYGGSWSASEKRGYRADKRGARNRAKRTYLREIE